LSLGTAFVEVYQLANTGRQCVVIETDNLYGTLATIYPEHKGAFKVNEVSAHDHEFAYRAQSLGACVFHSMDFTPDYSDHEKYPLAKEFLCTVCRRVPVDPFEGYDTCPSCVEKL